MRTGTILLIISLLFISTGCITSSSESTSKETMEVNKEVIPKTCEERAKELIPKILELRNDGGSAWTYYGNQQWKDGTFMEHFGVSFKKGDRTRQIEENHYIDPASTSFTYTTYIVDNDGRVHGSRTFSIRPVLTAIHKTKQTFKGVDLDYSTQQFVFADPNVVDCLNV
jgi:hypothetical protein